MGACLRTDTAWMDVGELCEQQDEKSFTTKMCSAGLLGHDADPPMELCALQ